MKQTGADHPHKHFATEYISFGSFEFNQDTAKHVFPCSNEHYRSSHILSKNRRHHLSESYEIRKANLFLCVVELDKNYSRVLARLSQPEDRSRFTTFSGKEPMATLQRNLSENLPKVGTT